MIATWTLHHGDSRQVLADLDDASIDAVVTDPPYELGFMGKGWDAAGIAYDAAMWAEVLRVLKPGGYLLAFGGTRTYHRMACAIEDAGFEIRDSINWLHGSGFPKSHNLKGDRAGWGTALKPAHEPIVVARKPLVGTVAANVLEWGTGALNIDGCRVGMSNADRDATNNRSGQGHTTGDVAYGKGLGRHEGDLFTAAPGGRWPANLVLTHHADCEQTHADDDAVWDCHPECPVAVLDAQSGVSKDGVAVNRNGHDPERRGYDGGWGTEPRPDQGYGGSGGASRYFTQTAWDNELDGWSFLYQAKANKRERNAGTPDGNKHPTVKPVALMRWLIRLVTPPGGTVLDPFTGSGTTGVAATLEGFTFVGIEQDDDYIDLAESRISHSQLQTNAIGRQAELFDTDWPVT